MSVVRIARLKDYVGQEVEIRGWLYNKRSSGSIHFLIVRDGSAIVQAIVTKDSVPAGIFEDLKRLSMESALIVRGTPREEKRAPGGVELGATAVTVVGESNEDYPIQKKEHNVDFLMDHRHLWIRTPRQATILRIRATIIRALTGLLDAEGFIRCDTPILTPAACEGTTTLFPVEYFDDQTAYLTQSGQLYNEATAAALGKVYCFGPTFRAEKSKTRRHLNEFWMLEPEMAYATLDDVMDLEERVVSSTVAAVLESHRKDLEELERDVRKLEAIVPPFPRIPYSEAVERLQGNGHPMKWGDDFGGDEETVVASQFEKPVFVHHYPTAIKAFYMKADPDDPRTCLSVDLLAPEGYGEICGGGQREENPEALQQRIEQERLPMETLRWYLDLRKYGSVPHAGFGLGLERVVMWICGLAHVREAIPFARTISRIYP